MKARITHYLRQAPAMGLVKLQLWGCFTNGTVGDRCLLSGEKPTNNSVHSTPCSVAASYREGQAIAIDVAKTEVMDNIEYIG